eukprot:366353-Chlamydomonas_euryale.AAC.5
MDQQLQRGHATLFMQSLKPVAVCQLHPTMHSESPTHTQTLGATAPACNRTHKDMHASPDTFGFFKITDSQACVATLACNRSHEGMLEQLESTHRELHATGEKLRSTEAQRIVSVRDAETLRAQLAEATNQATALKAALKQRCANKRGWGSDWDVLHDEA